MRLTLRTLLAYLDDILDPADAKLLGSKIQESEFATALVHQIRGSVRRLRLDAPALDAAGVGNELNSVAEYLDNVLPPEQVPALEKACLDDEVNLGEVASCHQILTLVLGEAAQVTDSMRKSAYDIAPTTGHTSVGMDVDDVASTDGTTTIAHAAHMEPPAPASTMIVGPAAYPPDVPSTEPPASPISPEPVVTPQQPPAVIETSTPERTLRVDRPSTKEAWRAESSAIRAELAEAEDGDHGETEAIVVAAAQAAAAPAAVAATVPNSPAREPYPDYLPQRSSWLRSAFMLGLIALLILAGLLLATGTVRDNFLTRWLGNRQQVADSTLGSSESVSPRDPASTIPSPTQADTNTASGAASDVTIVDPNLQEPAQESPASAKEVSDTIIGTPNGNGLESSPVGTPPSFVEPNEPQRFKLPEDSLPDLAASENFPTTGSQATPDGNPSTQLETPLEPEVDLDRTATVAPVPSSPEVTVNPLENQSVEDVAVGRASTVDLDRGPNAVLRSEPSVETPGTDTSSENAISAAEVAQATRSPAETSSNMKSGDVPSSDAAIAGVAPSDERLTNLTPSQEELQSGVSDLEPAMVAEPVAASPDVGQLAVNIRQPQDPALPTVATPHDIEPDLGRRAKPTSLRRDDQLLLLFDEDAQAWQRILADVQLQERDHLLGMPAFQSEIAIGENLVCSVHGVGRFRVGPGDDLSILDGSIVLSSREGAESVGIRFAGRRFEIHLLDALSEVAVEAYHQFVPGSDVATGPTHAVLKIYPMQSSIRVDVDDESFDIPKNRHLVAVNDYAPRTNKTMRTPKWMRPESLRIDRYTRDGWTKEFDELQDVHAWLAKKAENPRAQQVSLAARCLAEMDDFSAIVAALGDPSQSGGQYWMEHFQTLRSALTRGPEIQRLVKLQLEQAYGKEQADTMFEMLRGYNDKQLAAGAAAMLVRQLENPKLEMRVLAIENLYEITGARSDFRAAAKPLARSGPVRTWQRRLRAGRVSHKEPPELVRLLTLARDSEQ